MSTPSRAPQLVWRAPHHEHPIMRTPACVVNIPAQQLTEPKECPDSENRHMHVAHNKHACAQCTRMCHVCTAWTAGKAGPEQGKGEGAPFAQCDPACCMQHPHIITCKPHWLRIVRIWDAAISIRSGRCSSIPFPPSKPPPTTVQAHKLCACCVPAEHSIHIASSSTTLPVQHTDAA